MRDIARLSDIAARWTGRIVCVATVAFLLIPVVLVVVLSFSGEAAIYFPPREWGLRQYATLFTSTTWPQYIGTSFVIAIPTAVLSVCLSVPALFAIERTRMRGGELLRSLGMVSLVLPIVAYAVALYGVAAQLGLLGTRLGLILAHATLGVPLVLIIGGEALRRIPGELEHVAMTLGAGRLRAWTGITLRLLLPGLAAGSVFAFIMSFDEAVFVSFLGGPGLTTLPKAIFDSIRYGVDAVITAIATLLIVFTAIMAAVSSWLQRRAGGAR